MSGGRDRSVGSTEFFLSLSLSLSRNHMGHIAMVLDEYSEGLATHSDIARSQAT